MKLKNHVLFYGIFMMLFAGASSMAAMTAPEYNVSRKDKKSAWLPKVLLYGVLPATGIMSAAYGSLYIYNLTASTPLLAEYYEKRFFENTTIDPRGQRDLYQESAIDRELHVAHNVRVHLSSIDTVDDGIEYACYRQAEQSEKDKDGEYTLVYFGGTREDNGDIDEVLVNLVKETGVSIVAPNYPGYGLSTGKSSFENNQIMANAFIKYYQQENPNKKLIILGYSYGASVAINATYHHPEIDDLMIIGAYSSAKKEGWDYAKWYEKPLIPFAIKASKNNNELAIKTMPKRFSGKRLKITSFHGKEDETVPYSHQGVLSNAALFNGENVVFKSLGKYSETHLSIKPKSSETMISIINGIKNRRVMHH